MRNEMGMKILTWVVGQAIWNLFRGMWNYLRIGWAELPEYPGSQAELFYKCCVLKFGDVVEKRRAAVKVREEWYTWEFKQRWQLQRVSEAD